MPITVSDWIRVKPMVSSSLHGTMEICIEMEEHIEHMRRVGVGWINGNDVALFMDYSLRMMDRYLEWVNGVPDLTDDDKRMIINDVNTTFSIFIDKAGNFRDLGRIFADSVERGTMGMFFPTFIEPIVGFIHSRVYDSIISYIHDNETDSQGKIARLIAKRCGLYRLPPKEEEFEIKTKEKEEK